MGRKLIIVRHAKSDWDAPSSRDFDRPLNKRGKLNAPEMASRLKELGMIPNQIVSSPALRALTTAKYFASIFQMDVSLIQTNMQIYEASARDLLKVVNDLDDQYEQIALFGHNPGLTDFANYLGDLAIYNLPTCAVVILEFPFEKWAMVSGGTAKVLHFDYPKSGED